MLFQTDNGPLLDTIHIPEDTEAVIVLAQLDTRFFQELSGVELYNLEFTVYPLVEGVSEEPPLAIGGSLHSSYWKRSVKMETDELKKGDYVVHVSRRTSDPSC